MARIGVDYDTVKHAALKLLSQGSSPSVQRIRDMLGTGSNTTIAEHLKVWREEHAKREVHHLPANMPKELISAIEVLWQVAMEQAANQLAEVKKDLNTQQEQLKQDQYNAEKILAELRATLNEKEQDLTEKNDIIKQLQTELAVEQERLTAEKQAAEKSEKQHDIRLQNAIDEKHTLLEQYNQSQAELVKCQQALSTQAEKNQQRLTEERQRQEQSENRWLKMIDQSRQETDNVRKQFEKYKRESDQTNKKISHELAQQQHQLLEQVKQAKADEECIAKLNQKNDNLTKTNKKLTQEVDQLKRIVSKKTSKKTKK